MSIQPFISRLKQDNLSIKRADVTTLQVNIGKRCNQACHHCHVESGPKHPDNMTLETVTRLLELIENEPTIATVDITGGAPELNPHFRDVVLAISSMGKQVIDRCNLTVLFEKGQENTAQFLADNKVNIVASLPCYTKETVEAQRGGDVFDKSIKGLQILNSLGYGKDSENNSLTLDLVYNPNGAFLPPDQQKLESEYKDRLLEDFGIIFNKLFTVTNMPIKRYIHYLKREDLFDDYMQLLHDNFNPLSVPQVMCNNMISVGFDGKLYDCDFNQMLDLQIKGKIKTIWDVERLSDITSDIILQNHCYGCTAGAGSSCGGALL